MRDAKHLIVLFGLLLAAGFDAAASTAAIAEPPDYPPQVRQVLLDPDSSSEARNAALKTTFEAADAGNGSAAYQLAALFRSGEDHPAKATPRDPDTARFWLERCLTQRWCPRSTLAAMAELLLETDQPRDAMSWAQAATLAEREVHAKLKAEGRGGDSERQAYHAALLKRIFGRLPAEQRSEEAITAEFNAWLAQLEPVLQRLIDGDMDAMDASGEAPLRVDSTPKHFATPAVASQAIFMLRVPVGGTRADTALLIDGLPTPGDALALRKVANGIRFEAAPALADAEHHYMIAPISLDDGRFSLKKNRVNAAR